MRAIGLTQFGGPDVLRVLELPEPEAGPGQLRLRVRAAAVNPTDTVRRSGASYVDPADAPMPQVLGMDAAGTVEQIGEGTSTDLEVGDRVMAIVLPDGAHGAYAEQIVVPADSVVKLPTGATYAEAASIPMNGLTARRALDLLELAAGQRLAVSGAAGAVGGFAVQLAKADGLQVIADAAPRDEVLIRELGADIVLPRGTDYPQNVRAVVPGGVDGMVDTALLNRDALPAVRDGGRIATLRRFAEPGERRIVFHPVWVPDYALRRAKLDRLGRQAEAGQISMRVAQIFAAEQAPEAHRLMEAGGVRGRLILQF